MDAAWRLLAVRVSPADLYNSRAEASMTGVIIGGLNAANNWPTGHLARLVATKPVDFHKGLSRLTFLFCNGTGFVCSRNSLNNKFAGTTLAGEAFSLNSETLRGMPIIDGIRSDRLAQFTNDMNRHHSKPSAEALPADPLLLGPKKVEQSEVATEVKSPSMREEATHQRKRRANRGTRLRNCENSVEIKR